MIFILSTQIFYFYVLGGTFLRRSARRLGRHSLLCSLCGQEIVTGEEYWYCNGSTVCRECLPSFARAELAPYRQTRGQEVRP